MYHQMTSCNKCMASSKDLSWKESEIVILLSLHKEMLYLFLGLNRYVYVRIEILTKYLKGTQSGLGPC